MKKIFAICAVALVAAAMFTSCKKAEENSLTVKFNKNQWTAGEVLGNHDDNRLGLEAYETSFEGRTDCEFVQGIMGTTPGENNSYKFWYYENYNDVDSNENANWGVFDQHQEITAIDLAAHTIDAEVEETLKQEGKDDASLKITMKNAEWKVDAGVRTQQETTKGMATRR